MVVGEEGRGALVSTFFSPPFFHFRGKLCQEFLTNRIRGMLLSVAFSTFVHNGTAVTFCLFKGCFPIIQQSKHHRM